MALVLAVEDDRLSQRVVEKIYRNAGHDVLLSDSVTGALELLRRHVFIDLVVLDSHLGRDVGWSFVTQIRRLPFFRQLPVVVYTGYTERQEVLRYAALKVQAVHVKPFKAEVLLGELDRVSRLPGGLRSDLWEKTEQVCGRLNITAPEYGLLLFNAANHLDEDRAELEQRLHEPRSFSAASALGRLKQRSREIGVRRMDELAEGVAEQLRRGDAIAAAEAIQAITALIQQVRQRGQALLGTSTPPPLLERPDTVPPAVAAEAAGPSDPPDALAQQAQPVWQRVVHRPFWTLAACLDRLPGLQWSAEQWQELLEPRIAAEPVLQVWIEALRLMERAGQLELADAAQLLAEVPGFDAACARIVQHTTMGGDGETGPVGAAEAAARLGIIPAAVLAGLAGVVRASVPGPLDLAPLRRQAVVASWLALELGRLFRLRDPQEAAAGALARHFGFWCLAVVEPGLSALALAGLQRDVSLENSVERWFGASAESIGARLLVRNGVASAAALGLGPAAAGASEEPTRRAARTLAQLAADLAAAVLEPAPEPLAELQRRMADASFPAWVELREQGLPLPRDVREFAEAMAALAATSRWLADEAAT